MRRERPAGLLTRQPSLAPDEQSRAMAGDAPRRIRWPFVAPSTAAIVAPAGNHGPAEPAPPRTAGDGDREQALARALSPRDSHRDRPGRVPLGPGPAREERRQVCRQAGLPQPRPQPDLRGAGPAVARLRRLPAEPAGVGQGRARRHHGAEPAAVPGRAVRHPARRHGRGERQPALHASRARAPAQGLGRQGHRHRRELRPCPAAGAREHAGPARDHHPGRRHAAAAEALDRQPGPQEGEEDGAGLAHRRRRPLQGGARARRGDGAQAGRGDARGHRLPAVHGGHHGRVEGRDADPPQHPREHGADRGVALDELQGRHRHRDRAVAALPHLLPDRDAVVHEVGRPERARHQPARPAGAGQGARALEVDHHDRRQHAVQRPAQHPRLRQARLFLAEGGDRRRRRRAGAGGEALAAGDRALPHRRLRPDRGLARRLRQSDRKGLERNHRHSLPVDRAVDPRRRLQRASALDRRRRHREAHRRDLRPRPAGDEGLLEQRCGDVQGDAGRMAEDRRHRSHGRDRPVHDHRPQEGHDPGVRLQRVSERDRERDHDASRRARMRCRGRSRREDRRGGEGGGRPQGSGAHEGGRDRALQGAPHRLQAAAHVEFRDALPKTPIGKVLRRELRDAPTP